LSGFSSFVARAFLWLIGGAFVLGLLYLPLALLRGLVITTACFTEVLAEVRGVSGFDFEVSETDCWHSPAVSVYLEGFDRQIRHRPGQACRYPTA
jgi:hypothetical protein